MGWFNRARRGSQTRRKGDDGRPSGTVTVAELRRATDRLFEAISEQLGDELNFFADHYWTLDIEESFDLGKQPEILAGQVSDDVESVRNFSASDDFVSIRHESEHLVGVLRAIAAKELARFPE